MCAGAPRLAQSRFGMFGASRILRMWEFSIRMFKYICMCMHVCTRESCRSSNTGTWSAATWPPPLCPATSSPPRQCYRPAVFRHLRLIALSFPHGKIRRAFQNAMSFCLLFLNYDVWNCLTWNYVTSGVSVSCWFRLSVRSAIDVGFMEMQSVQSLQS